MKDVIILKKTSKKKRCQRALRAQLYQMAEASSLVDFARRYKWAVSNVDLNETKRLGLTSIKKY